MARHLTPQDFTVNGDSFFFVMFNPAPPLLARVKFISGADYRSVVILAGSVKSRSWRKWNWFTKFLKHKKKLYRILYSWSIGIFGKFVFSPFFYLMTKVFCRNENGTLKFFNRLNNHSTLWKTFQSFPIGQFFSINKYFPMFYRIRSQWSVTL